MPENFNEPTGGGSAFFNIIIENQTDQVLTIYNESNYEIGSVEPGEQITMVNQGIDMGYYPIEAKNTEGEVVFLETFTFKTKDKYHLERIQERIYKAVIPPL